LPRRCDDDQYGCYSTEMRPAAAPAPTPPAIVSLQDARQYTLQYINGVRRLNGAGPLVLDDNLTAFAQAGSEELADDHQPHQHFREHASELGFGALGENQGDPQGWRPEELEDQIGDMLGAMMREGVGGAHRDTLLAAQWTRLGVGIVNPGQRMYFTTDFAK
jgi:hypothetical protein